MPNVSKQTLASHWTESPTTQLETGGEILAYRELGITGGPPVLMLTHLGATLDEWEPRLIDALAQNHHVLTVDLPGVGASTGSVPPTIKAMADSAIKFIEAKGFTSVDIAGFSMGGFIAQQIALDRPDLVRRLVLTGTGPAGGHGINRITGPAYVYWDMFRSTLARTDAKEFLFFNRDDTGRTAAKAYLKRLNERIMDRDTPITVRAFRTQLKAIQDWGRNQPQNLSLITAPTLIANGDHDRMVPSGLPMELHRRIPNSKLTMYPNSGHGGVFQHHKQFNCIALEHLKTP